MWGSQVAEPLYNAELLRLAAATADFTRLDAPGASSAQRSPICGSRIIVDVALDDAGRISAVGMEVRACILGQASAALMAANAIGKDGATLGAARDTLKDFLDGKRSDPGIWPGLTALAPAQPHSARHGAIMLAFDAVSAATHAAAR